MSAKVLIIGAGVSGLTLAQSLRTNGIEFEIYERDQGPETRQQGWAVALHMVESHLRAIAPASAPSLESTSVSAESNNSDGFNLFDGYTREVKLKGEDVWPTFIRSNRRKLREWLSTELDIKWGKRYARHEIRDGIITAIFEDGSTAKGEVLIGADGVSSLVRSAIYHPKPQTLDVVPVGIIIGELSLPRSEYSHHNALGQSFYVVDGEKYFFLVGLRSYSSDLSMASYYWFFFFKDEGARQPDFWIKSASAEDRLKFVKETTKDMHPDLTRIFRSQPIDGMVDSFTLRDRIPTACPDGPCTLIGDATHPMTPFQGQGANMAMLDAIELSAKLVHAKENSQPYITALRAFEAEMIPRASKAVEGSRSVWKNMDASKQTQRL